MILFEIPAADVLFISLDSLDKAYRHSWAKSALALQEADQRINSRGGGSAYYRFTKVSLAASKQVSWSDRGDGDYL